MTPQTLNNLRLILEKGDMPGDLRLMFATLLDDYTILRDRCEKLSYQLGRLRVDDENTGEESK